MEQLRAVIISDVSPRLLWRLAQRAQNELPGMTVCGLIHDSGYERRLNQSVGKRVRTALMAFGDMLLCWMHGCPSNPNGKPFTRETLGDLGRNAGLPVACIDGESCTSALALMQRQDPDICLVLAREPPARLLRMPRLGSVMARRFLPEPKNASEIKIRALRVHNTGEETIRTISLPVEPLDTATSIALKADLVASDLLLETAVVAYQQEGIVDTLAGQDSQILSYLPYFLKRKTAATNVSPSLDTRPFWKLFFNSLLLAPFLVARNWYRRCRGRFPVIVFVHHLISDVPHHLGMPTGTFLQMVQYLQRHYRIVSLAEAAELLNRDAVDMPTVALSFDDGYQENFLTLRSVVEATGIPVSLFICTGLTGEQADLAHDHVQNIYGFNVLGWDQVAYLQKNGVEIGSHTRTHFDCGITDRVALEQEIVGSQNELQQHLGKRVRFFGFPFGKPENISDLAMSIARSNYDCLLSCFGGENFAPGSSGQNHLLRKNLQSDVWALELSLQGILDLRRILMQALGMGEEAHKIARVQATAALENTA